MICKYAKSLSFTCTNSCSLLRDEALKCLKRTDQRSADYATTSTGVKVPTPNPSFCQHLDDMTKCRGYGAP